MRQVFIDELCYFFIREFTRHIAALPLFELACMQTRFFFLTFAQHRYAMVVSQDARQKDQQIKVRVPESMRPELEAIAEERGESTSVIVRERLRSGVYFDPELARKLAEIAKEESTTVAQIVERFVKDGIACRAEIKQMAEQFRRFKKAGRLKRALRRQSLTTP